MEEIVEVLILAIFVYPGALIRWLFTGCSKPVKHFLSGDAYMNGMIGVTSIVILIVGIKYLILKW